MKTEEKKLTSKLIYEGKIVKLYVDEVALPDGKKAQRECIRHCGGAATLYVREGKVALVRQFRYLYGAETWEIPAGKIDEGEAPEAAARRELREEAGYLADVKPYLTIYPTPGYTDEIIYIYIAFNGAYVGSNLDDGEFLNVEFIPVEQALQMISRGEIRDSKTVSAIYQYALENHLSLQQ